MKSAIKKIGPDAPPIADHLFTVAYAQFKLKRYSNAILAAQRGLNISKKHFGDWHIHSVKFIQLIGLTLIDQNQYAAALKKLTMAQKIHPLT